MDFKKLCNEIKKETDFRKEVVINGISFTIGLASAEQDATVNSIYAQLDENSDASSEIFGDLRRRQTAYAIKAIKGEEIPELVEVGDKVVERGLYVLEELLPSLPGLMVDALFAVVTDLKAEAKKKIYKEVKFDWYEEDKLLIDDDEEDVELAEKAEADEKAKQAELAEMEGSEEETGVQDPEQFE